ncbi:unnamed protein product [Arctogadus glacialis]
MDPSARGQRDGPVCPKRFCGDVSPPSLYGWRKREGGEKGALGRGVEKQGGKVSDSVGKVGERGGGSVALRYGGRIEGKDRKGAGEGIEGCSGGV